MILFQIAKWMEDRRQIVRRIKEEQSDAGFLLHKIELADERMMAEAKKWVEKDGEDALFFMPELPMLEGAHQESYQEAYYEPVGIS